MIVQTVARIKHNVTIKHCRPGTTHGPTVRNRTGDGFNILRGIDRPECIAGTGVIGNETPIQVSGKDNARYRRYGA